MFRKFPQILACTAVLAASFFAASTPAAAAGCPKQNVQPVPLLINLSEYEGSIHCLVNLERTSHGLPALSWNGNLASAAQGHSSEMRWQSYFSHDSKNGAAFTDRILSTGYLSGAATWLVGENIAWGTLVLGTPKSIVNAWMNSPEHRANILESDFREGGIGADWGTPFDPLAATAVIVTQDFGWVEGASPKPVSAKTKKKAKKKRKKKKRAKAARKARKATR